MWSTPPKEEAAVPGRPRFQSASALLLLAFALSPVSPVRAVLPGGWSPVFTTTAAWDSNITNAGQASDAISALQLGAAAAASHRVDFAAGNALLIGAHFAAETWPRFDGLDRASLGPRLAWQRKFGLGALAPVFEVELAGDAVAARETGHAGLSGGVTLLLHQRLDASTRVSLTQAWSRHDARAAVFDRSGAETAAELTRDLDERWQLSLAVRWRTGDVLSYATPPRPDLVSLAKVRVPDTTFDRPFVAYSLAAHTLTGSLALSRTLGEATSLTFGYECRDTTRRPLRYVNHLVSAALARQF